ncbi:MAG: PAS domain-containing protein [Alphaproteobacteria bacterium]|nr:PAS domain-containing protein [Alphaproteobacteria bacterium]
MTDDHPSLAGDPEPKVGRTQRRVTVTDVARASCLLLLPTLVVVVIAVMAFDVPLLYALSGILVVATVIGAMVRRHYQELAVLLGRLEARAAAEDPAQVLIDHQGAITGIGDVGPAADLALALERSDRRLLNWASDVARETASRALVIESIPDPLVLIDTRSRVALANRAAREQFGHQIVGRDLAAVIRQPEVLATVRRALNGGAGGDVEIALAAPVERVFGVRIQALSATPDQPASALMLFVDLSAVRRVEQMRVDFVANVSHELRTPLATLMGFIETLQGPAHDDGEARDRFLEIMRSQANRMSRLVNDLLSLSRIESNEHALPKGRVALPPLLNTVRATLDLEARRKDMRVRLEIEDNLFEAVGEQDELVQVIQNLMDNAIKYGRPGTDITVSARRAIDLPTSYSDPRRSAVAIAVHNQGEGIAPEHIPRLTERFYRVDTARSRALGGTGLGLAIVKHILSRHRGTLTIESALGNGSTFTAYLPADAANQTTPNASAV